MEESKVKYIMPQAGFQEHFVRSNVDVVIGGGVLNDQPLDSDVITPNGAKKMGCVVVGDDVCDVYGGVQKVTMVLDKGDNECVEFRLSDGRKVESSLNHHWLVLDNSDNVLDVSAREIMKVVDLGNESYRIPNVKQVFFNGKHIVPKESEESSFAYITSYKLTGIKHTQCIQVSGEDHLYLTDNFVITRNCGKAQPLHSKILTPNGWTTMGELRVGDEISDTKGSTQKVQHIFERGFLKCLRFNFEDETSVECCDEHLWTVWDKTSLKYVTLEAKEIISNGIERYSLPTIEPVVLNQRKPLPLDPYFLGALIGDGCLAIEGGTSVTITTDLEIIEKIKGLIPYEVTMVKDNKYPACRILGSEFRNILRELNLFGKHSHEKFIPHEYLYASLENRKRLLQGLLDTDGYNDNRTSRLEYCTVSEHLAKDVTLLVKSLGGKVKTITKIGAYKKDGETHICRKAWRLMCRFPNVNEMFTLKRKQNNITTKREPRLNITSVEKLGFKEMRCILVSNDNHLYITDGFNPTHNSFAAILATAEPSLDPNFRACFTRRTFSELKSGGSLTDDFITAYGNNVQLKTTDPPRITFPQGSYVDFRQIADENIKKVTETWKGSQYDLIYMDELTSYQFSTFKYLLTRNRGKAKWSGKFRGTTNPERNCWVRRFIDWYIGADGQIIEERNGVVRYFYIMGDDIDSVKWGDSKEEVYQTCKIDIDKKIKALGGGFTYHNLIKSFTFYLGRMSENKASIGNNMDYAGSVAAVGGRQAKQLIEGNWNVSVDFEGKMPIPPEMSEKVFENDEMRNNDKWITADLADTGTDNTVILVWDGLHIIDYKILCTSTPKMNVESINFMANKHDIPDFHIIYDGIRAAYVYDYLPEAIPFKSYNHTIGKYGRMYRYIKDECYARLVEVIRREMLSFDAAIAKSIYNHQNINNPITFKAEFIEECSVVQFKDMPGGKKALLTKKEMNANLGKNRSMDLLDPIAMRMMPLLGFEYGEELIETEVRGNENDSDDSGDVDIFESSTWS